MSTPSRRAAISTGSAVSAASFSRRSAPSTTRAGPLVLFSFSFFPWFCSERTSSPANSPAPTPSMK